MVHSVIAPKVQRRVKAKRTRMVKGAFRNHKVSSLEQTLGVMYSFSTYLLSIYYMSDIMSENGDHSESFTLDMHPSSDKPYLVNYYSASV